MFLFKFHSVKSVNKKDIYFANDGIKLQGQNINYMSSINQIKIREPLEIQSTQRKKYLKWTNELEYNGHMIPILINYKVIHHTLTYRKLILPMIIPIHITYTSTYSSVAEAILLLLMDSY